jgi:hypothetical protein
MHDSFNADFYVTAATVIPILFLALTLQGPTYDGLISRIIKIISRLSDQAIAKYREGASWWSPIVSSPLAYILIFFMLIAMLIPIAGILGEWYAIWAIYNRAPSNGPYIISYIVILLLAVASGPVWRIVSLMIKWPETSDREDSTDEPSKNS